MSAPAAVSFESLKDQLIEYSRRSGALVVGVADADAFGDAPEGFRPGDLLPQARSVVVLGGAPPRAGDWISPVVELQETMGTSDRINTLGRKVAHFIEDRLGYYALFVPPGVNRGERPFLSLMLAAELAGCGSRSLAGPILHPTYGMLYFTAIITTAALPVDGPCAESACPAPACRDMWQSEGTVPCVKTCPIDDGGCLGGEIADGRFAAPRYDRARCTTRVYNHWIPGFQKGLELALATDDKEKRKMILYGSAFTRTLWSITYSASNQAQCFECMRVCPVGLEYRTKK